MDLRGDTIRINATAVPEDRSSRPNLKQDLEIVAHALGSRWRMIAVIVVIAIGAGIAYMWQAQPSYKSTVDILIDPRPRTVVGLDVVPTGLGSSSLGSDSGLVDSQVQLLSSRTLLTTVIQKEGLEAQAGPSRASLTGSISGLLKSLLYGPNRADFEGSTPFDRALSQLQSSLKIERLGNTYVLRVTVSSGSPQRAADIANSIAATYVEQGQDAINQETRQTADALQARLAQLKASSDQAEQELEKYRRDNGLLDAQGVTVDEQQLRDLNDQVTKASVDVETARARMAELDRLKGLPASALTTTNVMTSPTAEGLRTQLDTAVAEETSLAAIYGKQHPTLILARQKRAALERALLQEFNRIQGRAASDYQAALDAQKRLKALFVQYEQNRADSNEAGIRLKELQAAADSARSLYTSFAQRAAQAREQIDLPTNTARIISTAEPSSQPSDPRLPVVLGTAAVAGLMLGVGLAWLLYLLGVPAGRSTRNAPQPTPRGPRTGADGLAPVFGRRPPRDDAAAAPADTPRLTPALARRRAITGLFR
jgi:uncharacterized protein involved in exopolysaccharide biosynthesis